MAKRARISAYRVCGTPGCAELVTKTEPCPLHGRPVNAPWSKDRDPKAHYRFAKAVIARDGKCQRCGTRENLQAHHVKPGYDPSAGITLCASCHQTLDPHARQTPTRKR
jgi:hypothetical protein